MMHTDPREILPPARIDIAVDRDSVLVATTFSHPAGRCGEHVPSPHERCQAVTNPYLAAERFVTRRAVIIRCRCGESWREIAT